MCIDVILSLFFSVLYSFPCFTLKPSKPFCCLLKLARLSSIACYIYSHFWAFLCLYFAFSQLSFVYCGQTDFSRFSSNPTSSLLLWLSILSSIFQPNLRTNANRLFQDCPYSLPQQDLKPLVGWFHVFYPPHYETQDRRYIENLLI